MTEFHSVTQRSPVYPELWRQKEHVIFPFPSLKNSKFFSGHSLGKKCCRPIVYLEKVKVILEKEN